ncbi:MAG: hypothetical protein UY21_C0011G0040 [Microgenomates group bacterium GW2011_GWA1_48_10]|uniref:Type II secretion system protein GspG C-terminal domain-containing protein n=1 Tax=Candidatus Gottesmanbacteria bacterium RIFCSPHIGHO2_01_FULL_47_48 TaxID=1798381 RepID=A0A1F6A512_9BACT|nr:MAG: hypothetical protein UY21_C0011G0040 [Microgenomates group bacterium GW2011_GWA1_48_10]OGG19743.1 MAG: hypothetical protein A2721_01155 [Candidatus Gottesmanbacteria bacterium RIFCSPHIGHO2_01_FULL_47_48]
MKFSAHSSKGFTLIELLLVITIIAVLAVAVFAALNPAQRLSDAKDARRTSDVDTILTAVHQSIIDNQGTLPTNMPAAGTTKQIGTGATGCAISNTNCTIAAVDCVDLMSGTQNLSAYLASMPIDPTGGTTYTAAQTGYGVVADTNGIVTITACGTEGTTTISASR